MDSEHKKQVREVFAIGGTLLPGPPHVPDAREMFAIGMGLVTLPPREEVKHDAA